MKTTLLAFTLILLSCSGTNPSMDSPEVAKWKAQAERVEIIRDEWGIPHIYGKTDADAVFGMLYAQAEDDFNRIELNFLNAIGRCASLSTPQSSK